MHVQADMLNGYVEIAHPNKARTALSPTSMGTTDFTLSFAYFIKNNPELEIHGTSRIAIGTENGLAVGYDWTNKCFFVGDVGLLWADTIDTSNYKQTLYYDIKAETWYYFAFRFTDTQIFVYLNGYKILTANFSDYGKVRQGWAIYYPKNIDFYADNYQFFIDDELVNYAEDLGDSEGSSMYMYPLKDSAKIYSNESLAEDTVFMLQKLINTTYNYETKEPLKANSITKQTLETVKASWNTLQNDYSSNPNVIELKNDGYGRVIAEAFESYATAKSVAAENALADSEYCKSLIKVAKETLNPGDIISAYRCYFELSEAANKLINEETLKELYEAWDACIASQLAAEIDQLINDIGEVTLESEERIIVARTTYDKASSMAKELVTSLAILEEAENTFKVLKTEALIAAIKLPVYNAGEVIKIDAKDRQDLYTHTYNTDYIVGRRDFSVKFKLMPESYTGLGYLGGSVDANNNSHHIFWNASEEKFQIAKVDSWMNATTVTEVLVESPVLKLPVNRWTNVEFIYKNSDWGIYSYMAVKVNDELVCETSEAVVSNYDFYIFYPSGINCYIKDMTINNNSNYDHTIYDYTDTLKGANDLSIVYPTVILDSKLAISEARISYEALSDEAKLLVQNLSILESAENQYAELLAFDAAEKVDSLIRDIGPTIYAVGDCLKIDALNTSNNYLHFTEIPATDSFKLSFKMIPEENNNYPFGYLGGTTDADSNSHNIYWNSAQKRFQIAKVGSWNNASWVSEVLTESPVLDLPTNKWTDIEYIYEGSHMEVTVNGIPVASTNSATTGYEFYIFYPSHTAAYIKDMVAISDAFTIDCMQYLNNQACSIVRLDSGADISAAENAYAELPESAKNFVTEYNNLINAQNEYEILLNNSNNDSETFSIDLVKNLINDLSSITLASGDKIATAENAYSMLTEEQQSFVDNHDILINARTEYDNLIATNNQAIAEAQAFDDAVAAIQVTYTEDCRVSLDEAYQQYSTLTDVAKGLITRYADLEDKKAQYDALAFKDTVDSISVTADAVVGEQLNEAFNIYWQLSYLAQQYAYNTFNELNEKQVHYNLMCEAYNVDILISNIGEVTLDDYSVNAISNARSSYEALSEEAKAFVANYQTLLDAEARLNELLDASSIASEFDTKVNALAFKDLANITETEIIDLENQLSSFNADICNFITTTSVLENIRLNYNAFMQAKSFDAEVTAFGDVTLDSGDAITALEEKLAKFDANVLSYITTLDVLAELRARYNKLVADKDAADAVISQINAIGEVTYTEECKAKIDSARESYDNLTAEQQDLIDFKTYKVLADAETAYRTLSDGVVEAFLEAYRALPATVDTSDACQKAISAAYVAYSKLTGPGQAESVATEWAYVKQYRSDWLSLLAEEFTAEVNAITVDLNAGELLEAAYTSYENLHVDAKPLAADAKTLLDEKKAEYEALVVADNQVKAEAVVSKIETIGDVTYTSVCNDLIKDAESAYSGLTDAQKALVSNYSTLTSAISTYNALADEVTAFNNAYADLPSKATGDSSCNTKVDAVYTAYDALTDQGQKDAVASTYSKLSQFNAANNAAKKINAIGTVTYDDTCKSKIDAARTYYDSLSDAKKALVGNYDTLTAAETTYAELKAAAESEAAIDVVITEINAIGEVTRESGEAISKARTAFDALNDQEKMLVTNLQTLIDAESTYAGLVSGSGIVEGDDEAPTKPALKFDNLNSTSYSLLFSDQPQSYADMALTFDVMVESINSDADFAGLGVWSGNGTDNRSSFVGYDFVDKRFTSDHNMFFPGTPTADSETTMNLAVGEWNHFCFRRLNNNTFEVYVNGELCYEVSGFDYTNTYFIFAFKNCVAYVDNYQYYHDGAPQGLVTTFRTTTPAYSDVYTCFLNDEPADKYDVANQYWLIMPTMGGQVIPINLEQ